MRKTRGMPEQIRALSNHADNDLKHLIDEACRILKSPLILYDIDFKVLAWAENVSDAPSFWDRFIENGEIRRSIRDMYVSEGLADVIVSSQKPTLINIDKLKRYWIFGKISDKDGMPIACVHVMWPDRPYVEETLAAVEVLCKILTDAILNIPYYRDYAQRKLDACIALLIGGEVKDERARLYLSGYVEMVYKGLENNLYLAVADISQTHMKKGGLAYYRDLFRETRPAFKYVIYQSYILIVMSTGDKRFYPRRSFLHLGKLFERENIKVGISSRFENLFELSGRYREAVTALENGLADNREQIFFVYEDEANTEGISR